MSLNEGIDALFQLVQFTDGAILGAGLAYISYRCWRNFHFNSAVLEKIQAAPTVRISDLRSLFDDDSTSSQPLVIVRGIVDAKSTLSLRPTLLVSQPSGDKGVVLERSQTCVYSEVRGLFGIRALFGRAADIRNLFGKTWKDQKTISLRTVPFILVESHQWPLSDHVIVNLEGSTHPLPLTTVYQHLEPVQYTPYTFFQAVFGHSFPIGVLDEEKILPLGQEISAVGVCSLVEGNPQIKSCVDLPYFLSSMTKDQMVVALTDNKHFVIWCGIVLGSLSLGIIGYAITRSWRRWREERQQRQLAESRDDAFTAASEGEADEEAEEVPEGHLCVICLMRRKRSAFVPCGHLVCCHRCALAVERATTPKCPVCRQIIRTSVRVYDS